MYLETTRISFAPPVCTFRFHNASWEDVLMVGGLVANFPLEQFGATSPKTATRMPHSTNPLQTGSSRQFGSRIMAAWLRPPLPIRALPSLATNGLRQTRRPSCQAPADVAHLSFSLALRTVGLQSSASSFRPDPSGDLRHFSSSSFELTTSHPGVISDCLDHPTLGGSKANTDGTMSGNAKRSKP